MFPFDWYWFIGGDRSRVYSSARQAYFPISDMAYLAWAKTFGNTSSIATEAEMLAILATYGI
jgi:hypothetical protein